MPENDRLNGCLNEIELGFVERETTPRLLMKLGIQLRLAGLSLLIPSLFLRYSVSIELDPPSTTGFTRQSYSLNLVGGRITSQLTKI
jgi:hypothetical protein